MRVGIIALLHESNTFISQPTTYAHFERDMLLTGEAVQRRTADAHHEIGGFFAGLSREAIDAVPIFAARAVPFGIVAADAYSRLLKTLFAELERAGPLDGLLVAPHGAAVSEEHRDADGHWLSKVRRQVGADTPIIGTLDPHGNLSPRMVEACDALVGYRTNPHLDQRARGEEAALLMARTLRGAIRPTMAASLPPLAINIERQSTNRPPCSPLYELADAMIAGEAALSNTIVLGFPFADVAELGSSTIVITDNDFASARSLATELSQYVWDRREEFVGRLIAIDDALDQVRGEPLPVCLLDMGDNVGGGSAADGTHLLYALHRRGMVDSFVCICDPSAVDQAAAAGQGERVRMRVGGKIDQLHGEPFEAEFTVAGIHSGRFDEGEPRHGGWTDYDQGKTAVLRTDAGLTVMVTSRRMPPFSLQQLTSCGLNPSDFACLVAKGVHAPVAAYEGVCGRFIRVNTPGSTTADMAQLNYGFRRRPMFPFEHETAWQPSAGNCVNGHGA